MTREQIAEIANAPSHHRSRAEAMGFVFGRAEVERNLAGPHYLVRMVFSCVCGKPEYAMFAVDEFIDETTSAYALDIPRRLFEIGSFSRDHLLKDGYSEDQVDEMLKKAEAVQ